MHLMKRSCAQFSREKTGPGLRHGTEDYKRRRAEDTPLGTNSTRVFGGKPLGPVRAENLGSDVLVMQPANQGVRHDASDLLNRA
jgi:hypothetical protein